MRPSDAFPSNNSNTERDHDLQQRIRAEYAEMPGLKLTVWQAARLFNLEASRCERLLVALVDVGALCVSGTTFIRPDGGRRWA